MRKIISLLLACCILFLLVACNKNSGKEDDTTISGIDQSEVTDETGDGLFKYISDNLPSTMDFGRTEINVAMRNDARYYTELLVDEETMTANVVNSSVYKRNLEVEERLNVIINVMLEDNDPAVSGNGGVGHGPWYKVSQAVLAGLRTYDVAMGSGASAMPFALKGDYLNLRNVDNLDLTKGYWAQNMIDSMTLADTTFFATGAISTYVYDSSFVVYFNKKLCTDYGIDADDIYNTVLNGEWTLDKMIELSKGVYEDKNGDNLVNKGDVFGFGLQVTSATDGFFSSCDIPCTEVIDEKVVYSVNMNRLSTVVDKLKSFLWDNDSVCALGEGTSYETDTVYFLDQQFANDELMFVTDWLYSTSTDTMRNMESDFGVLPYPKYDIEQGQYYTYVHDKMTLVGIPSTVNSDRVPVIGAFLEAMASGGQNTVMPAYYEKSLTSRNIRDPESVETLNIIISNISNDRIWFLYSNVNTHLIRQQVWHNYDTLASTYRTKYEEANEELENIYDAFLNYKDR